jgi:hypothetical protein
MQSIPLRGKPRFQKLALGGLRYPGAYIPLDNPAYLRLVILHRLHDGGADDLRQLGSLLPLSRALLAAECGNFLCQFRYPLVNMFCGWSSACLGRCNASGNGAIVHTPALSK